MTPESRRNLRKEWMEQHGGSDKSGHVGILTDSITWKPTSITNEDAQWLDARRFSREDMASWFNLPAHMLNALENSSVRANLEEQNKAFYFHSLRPWLIRWQDETYRKLFTNTERRTAVFSVRFNANALLSADFETRMKGHATGRQWGWLSANDVLLIEDMDDIGNQGDIYMVPANMANAETGRAFGGTVDEEIAAIERAALTLQKIYLAVGVVITAEEARDVVRTAGFDLAQAIPDGLCGIHPNTEDDGEPTTDESGEPTDGTQQTFNWLRPALIVQLNKVIRLEGNKVQQAAKRSTKDKSFNFCGFLDYFYDNEFTTIVCDNLAALSTAAASAQSDVLEVEETVSTYAAESKEFWLDVAQTSTDETLYINVTERLGKWTDRAHRAADMIIEANNGH